MHGTATYRCDDTRGCVMQFWPPDDEHVFSKHVEAWNKLIVKQKFCASSWLITEINILKCTVGKTSKFILHRVCLFYPRWTFKCSCWSAVFNAYCWCNMLYVICYIPAVLNSVYELPEDGTDLPEHGVVKTRLLNVFVTCAGSLCYNWISSFVVSSVVLHQKLRSKNWISAGTVTVNMPQYQALRILLSLLFSPSAIS